MEALFYNLKLGEQQKIEGKRRIWADETGEWQNEIKPIKLKNMEDRLSVYFDTV